MLLTTLELVPGGVALQLDGHPVVVEPNPRAALKLQETPIEAGRVYRVFLWFKTVGDEVESLVLSNLTLTKKVTPEPRTAMFRATARLVEVSVAQRFLVLRIEPNAGGQLGEAFELRVWASARFLKALPSVGKTLVLTGEYQPVTRQLIARNFTPLVVGPRKVFAGRSPGLVSSRPEGERPEVAVQQGVQERAQAPAPTPSTPAQVTPVTQETRKPKRIRLPKQ